MAVSSYPETRPGLLMSAILENPKAGVDSLYQRVSKSYYVRRRKFTFLTVPGVSAVLLYSGSLAVVLGGMALITGLVLLTEMVAERLTRNPFLLGVAGVVFLVWRMKLADMFIAVTAPVGIAITGMALVTGAIWGRPTWGAWWVWDARTTSVLVLFFLYVGLVALRQAIPRAQAAARAASVLAIVGTVNIPIIKYSVDWWLTLHQPASLSTSGASMPASMWVPLVINIFGLYFFIGAVLLGALRHEVLQREAGTQWVRDWVRGT